MITALVIMSAVPLGLMVLTAVGAHRRGDELVLAVLSGLVFPLTWIAWYVTDNRRAGRGAFRGRPSTTYR